MRTTTTIPAILLAVLLPASIAAAGVFQLAWDDEIDTTFGNAGRGVATDAAGNAYVCGEIGTTTVQHDWITIKYDAAGDRVWTRSFDGLAGQNDEARHIGLDAAGNVYVGGISFTGGSFGAGPKYDVVVIKYTPDGDVVWQHTFNSVNDNDDFIEDMVVMPDGTVYVVGYSYAPVGEPADADYLVYRLGADGQPMWWTFWDGPHERTYWLQARADADATGFSIAAMTERLIGPTDADDLNVFTFAKFSPAGALLAEGTWEPPFNANLPDTNWLSDAALDPNGALVAVGRYDGPYDFETGPEEPARAVAIKFAANGDVAWVAENDTELSDGFDRIVIDGDGRVLIAGTYNIQGAITTHAAHVTAAYDADGAFLWEDRFDGAGEFFDGEGYAAITDTGELLIATGYFSAPYDEDIRFVRYEPASGATIESWTFNQGSYADRILGLAIDAGGDAIITGFSIDALPGGGFENASLMAAKVITGTPNDEPADLDGNGVVDVSDLVALILAWGGDGASGADITGDGVVDVEDLVALILAWG